MTVFQNFCSKAEEFIHLSLLSLLTSPWGRNINKRGVCISCSYNSLCKEVGHMSMIQSMVYSSHSQLPKEGFS